MGTVQHPCYVEHLQGRDLWAKAFFSFHLICIIDIPCPQTTLLLNRPHCPGHYPVNLIFWTRLTTHLHRVGASSPVTLVAQHRCRAPILVRPFCFHNFYFIFRSILHWVPIVGSERSLSPGPLPGGFSTQWPPQIFPTARPPMVVPNNATSQGIRSAMAPVTSPSPSMNTLGQQPPTAQSSRRAARLACPIRTTDPYLLLEWYQADAILLWKYCQCLRDENCRLELQHIPCDSRIRALGRDAAAHGHLVNSLTNKLKTQELAIAELISELEYLRARLHNYETASVQ